MYPFARASGILIHYVWSRSNKIMLLMLMNSREKKIQI